MTYNGSLPQTPNAPSASVPRSAFKEAQTALCAFPSAQFEAGLSPDAMSAVPTGARLRDGIFDLKGHEKSDFIIEECPVALIYNGISHAVMMATPVHLEDFALGFSLSEGIASATEIYDIEVRPACGLGFEVHLEIASEAFWRLKGRRRSLVGRTGCGLCGVESLSNVCQTIAPLPRTQRFNLQHLEAGLRGIAETEILRSLTGGTHAAVWLRPDGSVAFGREDVGRHVALDKLLGQRARTKEDAGALFVSSRASYEMVQKAARCGVEILFAVSAPTMLAIETAEACGMTLVAFCRGERANIYTGRERLFIS